MGSPGSASREFLHNFQPAHQINKGYGGSRSFSRGGFPHPHPSRLSQSKSRHGHRPGYGDYPWSSMLSPEEAARRREAEEQSFAATLIQARWRGSQQRKLDAERTKAAIFI